jgi:hypothetical protein
LFRQDPSFVNREVHEGGVTLNGFLYLHQMLIETGKVRPTLFFSTDLFTKCQVETVWTVVRHFGYDTDLELRAEYLASLRCADCKVGQSYELSVDKGLGFLYKIFQMFDKDGVR